MLGRRATWLYLFSAKSVESLHVDGVETLANAKEEDTYDDKGNQHRKGDADFDDERHSLGARGSEDQAIFQRHKANNLSHGIAPRDHQQQADQKHGQRSEEHTSELQSPVHLV